MAEHGPGWTAYADGSCIGNPGRGGWGVVLIDPAGAATEYSGADPATTNNRMEITAAIEALRRVPADAAIAIHSDSQYVIKTMTMGWRRRENLDLWAPLDQETARRRVRWQWVRGHNGDPLNERADELARSAAEDRVPRASRAAPPPASEPARPSPAHDSPARDSPAPDDHDRSIVHHLTPLLHPGEDVRHCRGCRRLFVTADDAHFCALAACQLKARATKSV
jgi:ribonuclease HI